LLQFKDLISENMKISK